MVKNEKGISWLEPVVAMAAAGLLGLALFKLGSAPRGAGRIEEKGGFHERAALAADQIRGSIAMAGFGITRMEVLRKSGGARTDTLTIFSNLGGRSTTLIAPAAANDSVIALFDNPGLAPGVHLGICDGDKSEYALVKEIDGDSLRGFRVSLASPLAYAYPAGAPDVYPVQRELYFIDLERRSLIHFVDERRMVLAPDMREFRVQLRDQFGAVTAVVQNVKAVTFSLAGSGTNADGASGQMSISSTAIARTGR
jgi:hypothetical protein